MSLRSERFTYAMRIELADIFADETLSPYHRLKAAFVAVHGYSPTLLPIKRRVRELTAIAEEFGQMVDEEEAALHYEPTAEEVAAGISDYNKKVGHLGMVKSIAQTYSRDPDEVLQWPWSKVFGILLTDLEEYKYNQRLSEAHARSARTATR